MRYYSPQRMFLREAFYDRRGYVNSAFATPMVFVFNKQLVSREEAPKSMSDLLKPQWQGRLVMDAEVVENNFPEQKVLRSKIRPRRRSHASLPAKS